MISGVHHLARVLLDDVRKVGPATGTSGVPARAALTVLISQLTLVALDRSGWSLYATFGAFASLFGTPVRYRTRWRTQAGVGAALVATVMLGALVATSAHRGWLAVPVTALVAGAAAVGSDRFRLRPPGPLFFVFAVSSCAAAPAHAGTVLAAGVVAAATALLAVLIGVAECAIRGTEPAPPPAPHRRTAWGACMLAVGAAGAMVTAVGVPYPYWAAISASVPFSAPTVRAQTVRGVHRVLGTLGGLALASVLLWLPLPAVGVVVVAAAMQACTELIITRNYGLALVFITPLALLLMRLARPADIGPLLGARLVETVIGVVVGVLAAMLADPRTRRRVAGRVSRLRTAA